jgi:hypothetical protein
MNAALELYKKNAIDKKAMLNAIQWPNYKKLKRKVKKNAKKK